MTAIEDSNFVSAYFPTPEGGILRLRTVGDPRDSTERLELVQPHSGAITSNGRVKEGDSTVITIMEGTGFGVSKVYNAMVEPLIRVELKAAEELLAEAWADEDTISFMAQTEYIDELKADLRRLE